jgi:hypothetical protein
MSAGTARVARISRVALHALLLFAWVAMSPAHAGGWPLPGTRTIVVTTAEGERIPVGSVQFTPGAGDSAGFKLTMDTARFTDYFLSMREFKCLPGTTEVVCHVPYPYPQPGVVTPANLAWLEHSLLFFYKLPREFGAQLWNGIYFRLRATESALVGTPQAIDLNLIGAPPDDPTVPPYGPAQRDDFAPGKRWLRSLSIE